jgi:hypothetical protein
MIETQNLDAFALGVYMTTFFFSGFILREFSPAITLP